MRLGFYTYSYTDRLEMPVVECLERVEQTGYSGIDVSGTHGPSADPSSFDAPRRKLTRRTAERLQLRIEAVITHETLTTTLLDPKREPLDLAGSVDLAVDLGADVVTFHMGGYPPDVSRNETWHKTVQEIRRAADYGAQRHVDLAVDGVWYDWIVDSPESLSRLFADVDSPAFGVNFDPCYLTLMGIDPAEFARKFRKRLVHAHLKDYRFDGEDSRPNANDNAPPKWTHLLPGRGRMDYSQVFAALREVRFQRSVAVECFTDMEFAQACDECYTSMTEAAAKAGVKFQR